ncbi:ScbR family autoregulator-binding transcription factor [Calidifontibacter indicus]|uniref:TetR family transcriptional regulator n=1 Tax=Calidifontibacter indicus TaxID=419650 RepID=A0A3D9UMA9_9MICO|nr:ScbR family autoregulator-binding transcription factor [Calidifontibacter indicus]REF29120.1 TetR family transcriptional regulator [Calidifontibacter indicus]
MPTQARAFVTRERIMRGAAQALSQNGYEGTTIKDILDLTGVTKGALYFHFSSKDDLARAVLTAQSEWLSTVELTGSAAQQAIDTSYVFGVQLQTDELIRASVRLTTEGHGLDDVQRSAFDAWLNAATALCRQAKSEGSLREGVRPKELARTLTASVNGIQLSSLVYSKYSDIRGRLHDFWKLVAPATFTDEALTSLRLSAPRK